jgi:hypothetical protein
MSRLLGIRPLDSYDVMARKKYGPTVHFGPECIINDVMSLMMV